jgi:hypothetical protein
MRKSVTNLLLERCAQTVEETIMPNLAGAFAREQAGYTAQLLHILAPAVEDNTQELREENEVMRKVLRKVLKSLRAEYFSLQNEGTNRLIEKLDLDLKKAKVMPPDVSEENYNLKEILVEIINSLDDLSQDIPIKMMSSLRQQIRSSLRQQLDHGLTRVTSIMARL